MCVSPIERALCYVIISGYKSPLVGEVAVQIERYRRVNGLFLVTRHFGAEKLLVEKIRRYAANFRV